MRRVAHDCLIALVPLALASSLAHGGAIDVPQQDARASGQAEAFAAQADDVSAIYNNPAGLTQLHGINVTTGGSLIFPDFEFHGAMGREQEMHLPTLLPHTYVESDFGLQRFRFGIGVNNVYGINEDWGNLGPLNTLIEHSHLYLINLAPTVAYQINDSLSIGAAFNVYYGDFEVSHAAVLGPPPTPVGTFHFRGEDFAFGATPGIMWKLDDRNTLAAVYRSPFKMAFSGQARVKARGIPEIGPSHSHADLDFPQVATLAYAVRPLAPLKLEADVVWTDWDMSRQLGVFSTNAAFRQTVPLNWKSGFQYRFGVQYDLTPHWTLRTGYAFGQNAVPSTTFSPLVPDANYHLIAVGAGYSQDNWAIDVAYQFIYRETRHIANSIYGPLVNGTWDNNFNEVMVSLTVKL